MALISTFVNPNTFISENINDAFKQIEEVLANLDQIKIVAAAIESGEINPQYYTQAYIDATFALISNTYTTGDADDKFAQINNFNSKGINDDAQDIVLTLTVDGNVALNTPAWGWHDDYFAIDLGQASNLFTYDLPDSNALAYTGLYNNAYVGTQAVGTGAQIRKMYDGASAGYLQINGSHRFYVSLFPTDELATALQPDNEYIITAVNDTDFTAIGASVNAVGEKFFANANAPGTGTGTAVNTALVWDEPLTIHSTGNVVIPTLQFTNAGSPLGAADVNGAINEIFTFFANPGTGYVNSGAASIGFHDQYNYFNDVATPPDTVEDVIVAMWSRLQDDANGYNNSGSEVIGVRNLGLFYGVGITNVQEALEAIPTTLASTTPNQSGASKIGIQDEKNEIDASTVEGALSEIVHHSFAHTYKKINVSTAITEDDHGAIIHIEGGTGITLSLPSIGSVDSGFYCIIDVKSTQGNVILQPVVLNVGAPLGSGQTEKIDEEEGIRTFSSGDYLLIQSNGVEWEISLKGNTDGNDAGFGGIISDADINAGTQIILPTNGSHYFYSATAGNSISSISRLGSGYKRITITFLTTCTLVHDTGIAKDLDLPGEQNIDVKAGDTVEFLSYNGEGVGLWKVTNYQQNTTPAGTEVGHVLQVKLKTDGNWATGTSPLVNLTNAVNKQDLVGPILSESITPTKDNSKILIEAVLHLAGDAAGHFIVGLFEGNQNFPLTVAVADANFTNKLTQISIRAETIVNSTNTVTFNLEVGTLGPTVFWFNGIDATGTPALGGKLDSSIKLTEIGMP